MGQGRPFSQLPDHTKMRGDCLCHRRKFMIGNIKFFAGLFNYFTYGRIMYMADSGEQMMFYLKIQSADKPGNDFIPRSKVSRSPDLKNSPFFLNFLVVIFRNKVKFDIFDYVCQLKNQCKRQAHSQVHESKADCPCLPSD